MRHIITVSLSSAFVCFLSASHVTLAITKKLDRLFPVAACPFPRSNCAETSLICPTYCDGNTHTPLCPETNKVGACCEEYTEYSPSHCPLGATRETTELTFFVPAVGTTGGSRVAITIRRIDDSQPEVVREISYLAFISETSYLDHAPTQTMLDRYKRDLDYCSDLEGCDNCARQDTQNCYQGDGRPTPFVDVDGDDYDFGFEEDFTDSVDSNAGTCFGSSTGHSRPHGTWALSGGANVGQSSASSSAPHVNGNALRLWTPSSTDHSGATATLLLPFVPSGHYVLYGLWYSSSDGSSALTFDVMMGDEVVALDQDADGVLDACDNCPTVPNGVCAESTAYCDQNHDGILESNEDVQGNQADSNGDGIGDACPDTTPPTTTGVLTPGSNAAGWNNSDVVVTFTAVDDPEGSGVASMTVAAIGAQSIPSSVTPGSSASVTITAEGVTDVTYFATDNAGNSGAPQVVSVRIDKTTPRVDCFVAPALLWPPNQSLVTLRADVRVADVLSGAADFLLESVRSNEVDAAGYGADRPYDIVDFLTGTPDLVGKLRAERLPRGSGRIYTLAYNGRDKAGNVARCLFNVMVPHDRGDPPRH